ncbi:hypothetical protein FCV25MIE_17821 [Fagus crenata]
MDGGFALTLSLRLRRSLFSAKYPSLSAIFSTLDSIFLPSLRLDSSSSSYGLLNDSIRGEESLKNSGSTTALRTASPINSQTIFWALQSKGFKKKSDKKRSDCDGVSSMFESLCSSEIAFCYN